MHKNRFRVTALLRSYCEAYEKLVINTYNGIAAGLKLRKDKFDTLTW